MKNLTLTIALSMLLTVVNAQSEHKNSFVIEGEQIIAKFYHDNGTVAQTGTYNLRNKLHGLWTSYNDKGEKQSQGQYFNGKKVGLWSFYNNDRLILVEYDTSKIAQVTHLEINDQTVVTRYDK